MNISGMPRYSAAGPGLDLTGSELESKLMTANVPSLFSSATAIPHTATTTATGFSRQNNSNFGQSKGASSDTDESFHSVLSSGRTSPMIPCLHRGLSDGSDFSTGKEEQLSQTKRRRRRLRFAMKPTIIEDQQRQVGDMQTIPADPCTQFLIQQQYHYEVSKSIEDTTWWTRDELKSFRESARSTCRKVRERKAFTTCLDVAYQTISADCDKMEQRKKRNASYAELQGEASKEDLMDLIHRGLAKWSLHGHSCRGLERRVSDYQSSARQKDINKARQAVFDEQDRQDKVRQAIFEEQDRQASRSCMKKTFDFESLGGVHSFDEDNFKSSSGMQEASRSLWPQIDTNMSTSDDPSLQDPDVCAILIEKVSRERTMHASHFARMMGEADAAAAAAAAATIDSMKT